MGRRGKSSNPVDAYRKKQAKRQIKKNKERRNKERDERLRMMEPEKLMAELRKVERNEKDGQGLSKDHAAARKRKLREAHAASVARVKALEEKRAREAEVAASKPELTIRGMDKIFRSNIAKDAPPEIALDGEDGPPAEPPAPSPPTDPDARTADGLLLAPPGIKRKGFPRNLLPNPALASLSRPQPRAPYQIPMGAGRGAPMLGVGPQHRPGAPAGAFPLTRRRPPPRRPTAAPADPFDIVIPRQSAAPPMRPHATASGQSRRRAQKPPPPPSSAHAPRTLSTKFMPVHLATKARPKPKLTVAQARALRAQRKRANQVQAAATPTRTGATAAGAASGASYNKFIAEIDQLG